MKALMQSADLAPEEYQEEPSKFDLWLEKKLGDKRFQSFVIGSAVALGLGMSILLFFLLPMVLVGFLDRWIQSNLVIHLLEGLVRMLIFLGYMLLVSRMKEMKRVFAYHGAEHKTIRCYEAGLPLTVENVRNQTRLHPRCGTSFIFLVLIISILVYSVFPITNALFMENFGVNETIAMILRVASKLLLLPVIVGISYEIIRLAGKYDNIITRIISTPGLWVQRLTTKEPDKSQIEVAIEAMNLVIPENNQKTAEAEIVGTDEEIEAEETEEADGDAE